MPIQTQIVRNFIIIIFLSFSPANKSFQVHSLSTDNCHAHDIDYKFCHRGHLRLFVTSFLMMSKDGGAAMQHVHAAVVATTFL